MKPTLYVMCGISGSGKSYHAASIKELEPNTEIVSTDAIREEVFGDASVQDNPEKIFQIAYNRTENLLKQNKNVVFDAMNLRGRDRFQLISRFDNMATMICVVTGNDAKRAIENQKKRTRHVPESVILSQAERFKMPTIEEGWEEIWSKRQIEENENV